MHTRNKVYSNSYRSMSKAKTKTKTKGASQAVILKPRTEKLSGDVLEENKKNANVASNPVIKFSWDEFQGEEEGIPTKILKRDISSYGNPSNSTATMLTAATVDKKLIETKTEADENLCDSDDEDQENFNYMQIRMQNMKDNENFLASIGIFKAKEELKQTMSPVVSSSAKKSGVSQRGLKLKKEPVEPLPLRKSLRLSRLDPSGNPLPEPEFELSSKPQGSTHFHQEACRPEVFVQRLPEGPISMKNCVYSKFEKEKAFNDVDQFCTFVHIKSLKKTILQNDKLSDNDVVSKLDKLSLPDERVAKVVPGRVFSLEWYPSADKLIAVAGDNCGHIGFWNIMAEEKNGLEIVTAFKPHIKPVSQLSFSPSNTQKLYSSSYDSTLRCLDFQKSVFDEMFSVPEENDDLFRDFSFVDSNIMVVAQYSGFVSVVDTRTSSTSAEQSFRSSKKNLHSIHVNPQCPHHFITTGADSNIYMWDLRHLDKKSPKSLVNLKEHTKTVSSAYFSPNGQQILSSSADDTILLYSLENASKPEIFKRIRHNNFTGRWLTRFRPTWHPTVDNIFVTGSMARPRRIEVFDSTEGSLISTLESDNLNSVCSLNKFHPFKPTAIVGANSSGRLHVFM